MEKLLSTLPAILKVAGSSPEMLEAVCVAAWKPAVGEALSEQAVPLNFQAGTLRVAVADHVWKKQLDQMRGQLLFRLNRVLGQTLVQSLELEVDAAKVSLARKTIRSQARQQSEQKISPDLLLLASAISDAGLRRAFLGAAVSCVNRVEGKQ
jgi:hypothetical protein